MFIVIREENKFMPPVIVTIKEHIIEVEENNKTRALKYDCNQIKDICVFLCSLFKDWKDKYIDNDTILDDDVFSIVVVSSTRKEYYVKNKYPSNWDKFILFRNKLLREEL